MSLMRVAPIVVVSTLLGTAARGAESFDQLAKRIPRDANALVLIDVEQTLAAPLAQAQGWSRKLETAYVERPVFLPPEARKLALAAKLICRHDFRPAWELAVMELSEPAGVRAIARSQKGYVDELQGVAVAVTPLDAAFVDLGDNILATVRPADRQFLSRWIAFAHDRSDVELSDYLQSALTLVSDRVQVLLAIDLADVMRPEEIEEKLSLMKWPSGVQPDLTAAAATLGKLQGVALRLAIGDKCQAQLQIDFGAPVEPLKPIAKPLVMQALANLGFQSEGLSSWTVSTTTTAIKMEGELSTDGQRRVFSVIELPNVDRSEYATADAAPGENEVRDRSLAYFRSTQTLVEDLRKGIKGSKGWSAWMERYARRIDDLPVLNVDEQLLDYGDKLAESLRIMSLAKQQAGIRAGVRNAQTRSDYSGYGYADASAAAADRSQAKREEMSYAYDTRAEGWKLIDDNTADMRRAMTKKYGVEF